MDNAEKNTDDYAIAELTGLIESALVSTRIPRGLRQKVSTILEATLRENLRILRQYVRAVSYDGRAAEMMEMYGEGHTLDEIGTHFSVTRERIRQILTSTFGNYRTVVPQEVLYERSLQRLAERTIEWDEAHGDDVARLFAEGKNDSAIARELDIARTRVVDFRSRKGLRRTRGQDWTNDEIKAAMKKAVKDFPYGLTIAHYNEWRDRVGADEAPSYLTILVRFETFEDACVLAEVAYAGRSNTERRSDYISPDRAREHLAMFLDWTIINNKRATSGTFAEYRESYPDTPSMTVMSRRLGGFRSALDELISSRPSRWA